MSLSLATHTKGNTKKCSLHRRKMTKCKENETQKGTEYRNNSYIFTYRKCKYVGNMNIDMLMLCGIFNMYRIKYMETISHKVRRGVNQCPKVLVLSEEGKNTKQHQTFRNQRWILYFNDNKNSNSVRMYFTHPYASCTCTQNKYSKCPS